MLFYPFPDRVRSRNELRNDILYEKIPEKDRVWICDAAWNMGVQTAEKLMNGYPDVDIYQLVSQYELDVVHQQGEKISAGYCFFGEFAPKEKRIYLYRAAVQRFAANNSMTEKEAEELILAHEFYHFLEENIIGKTSERYQIPVLSLGRIRIGKCGVKALSEIGAHGFARTYWERKVKSVKANT